MDRQSHSLSVFVLALLAAPLLTGCPGRSLRSSPDEKTIEQPAAPLPAPTPRSPPTRENHLSPATNSLVTQTHTLMARGDLDGASSTLDRALRIEPNNPLLWVERGKLRLAENDPRQAEGCARKALALASGDRAAQAQSGHLLADALRAQKRNQEAQEVEAAPYMH
jgi:tetratricopeptide (TPR) repeat protein